MERCELIISSKTKRILWIDDDVNILDKQIDLVRSEGWPIDTVDCASEAVRMLQTNSGKPYRGILLDSMMNPIPDIGPHHAAGILTGTILAQIAIERNWIRADNIIMLTNCKQPVFFETARKNNLNIKQKSQFHGRKLARLIEQTFDTQEYINFIKRFEG